LFNDNLGRPSVVASFNDDLRRPSVVSSQLLEAESLGFGWVESSNSLFLGVVSSELDVLNELPSAFVFKLFDVRSIGVFLEVLGSSSEDSESTVLER